mgnify:CR=1 FL=1
MILDIIFLIAGLIVLIYGANMLVDGGSALAHKLNISAMVIGLTIVAFGTSTPELVVNTLSSVKGSSALALGNILGSNIFNILFVIGTVALICPVPFESRFVIDTVVAILCGVLLWGGTIRHKELRKPCGVVMLLCYAAYFVYLAAM